MFCFFFQHTVGVKNMKHAESMAHGDIAAVFTFTNSKITKISLDNQITQSNTHFQHFMRSYGFSILLKLLNETK